MTPGEALAFCNDPANAEALAEMEVRLTHISQLPLYESVEAFFAMSSEAMNENENAFVQAFLDVVLKFSADASSDLNSFLEWWDEESRSLTLFSPDGQDAIRLITIHKSKGLEFDVVLSAISSKERSIAMDVAMFPSLTKPILNMPTAGTREDKRIASAMALLSKREISVERIFTDGFRLGTCSLAICRPGEGKEIPARLENITEIRS